MEIRDFNKLGNLQAAFRTLHQYNQYVLFPVSDEVFDNPILEKYFESPLNALIERDIEKFICVSAVRAVYENTNIPQRNKEQSARNTARDLREAMKYAKLEYKSTTLELTPQEYNRRKRIIPIVRRAVKINMAKTVVKNATIPALATAMAGPIGGAAAVGGRLLWKFLPEKVKEPIVKNVQQIKEDALDTIENSVTYVRSTSIGQKIEKAVETVKPYVRKAVDTVKNTTKKLWEKAKSFWPF